MAWIELNDDGVVTVHDQLPPSVKASALGVAKQFWLRTRFYGDDGFVWRGAPQRLPHMSLPRRLLAHTVYNPRYSLATSYEKTTPYELAEAKDRITRAIKADDDVGESFMTCRPARPSNNRICSRRRAGNSPRRC